MANKTEELLQGIFEIVKFESDKEKNAYTKESLLNREIEVTQGLVIQKEIEIEASWKVLNQAQKEKEKLMAEIADNNEKMMEIKAATPMPEGWEDQIKKLVGRNVVLGETKEIAKNGDKIYRGEVLAKDREIEHYRGEITQSVGKREYYKTKLGALMEMKKDGATEDYEKFQEEMVNSDKGLKPIE